MEILYIWLYDYKNFKEQGFNFSSEFIFDVEKDDDNSYTLNISKNENFIPNFFEKPNILNATAIIGQNGSGKSNILDFIKNSFPSGYSTIQSKAIIAYRLNDDEDIYAGLNGDIEKKILLIPNSGVKINVRQNKTEFKKYDYLFDMPTEAHGFQGQNYSSADYVFYSNIFDLRNEDINMEGFYNLSTLALLKSDTSEHDENHFGGNYDNFRKNEIKRNIQFLLSNYKYLLDNFPLPEILFIEILNNDLKYFQQDRNLDVQKLLTFFKGELSNTNLDITTRILNNLYISVFLNFIVSDREFSTIEGFIKESDVSFSGKVSIKEYISNFFINLPNIKYQDKTNNEIFDIQNHQKKFEAAINFFSYLEKLLLSKSFEIEEEKNTSKFIIKYSVKKESFKEIIEFLDLYINLKGLTDFLGFSWRNLSSGEQSMFTFISRFYDLKHHQIQHKDLKKNLVILIDEGDTYFHPAWQKKFFQITINYLSDLFYDHNLQFIFTANTPFITSDLPKSNVIFIEKKPEGKIYVHGAKNDRAETFAGNIHTLFADSFYMEGALMGEFAKHKINKLIEYLNGDSKEINEDFKKTIDIIGEPVLKRKLQEMWFERFGVEEEIVELQNRIEELKKKRK